jgi:hypothetical protein
MKGLFLPNPSSNTRTVDLPLAARTRGTVGNQQAEPIDPRRQIGFVVPHDANVKKGEGSRNAKSVSVLEPVLN